LLDSKLKKIDFSFSSFDSMQFIKIKFDGIEFLDLTPMDVKFKTSSFHNLTFSIPMVLFKPELYTDNYIKIENFETFKKEFQID
jgi:hypothetical protein